MNDTGVSERQIGTCGSEAQHCPGSELPRSKSLKLVSNTVEDQIRTVVLTRALRGDSKQHYTFDTTTLTTLPFITAIGSSQQFAYHAAHDPSVLTLTSPSPLTTCLCADGVKGSMCDTGGVRCRQFTKNCFAKWDGRPEDSGADLLWQRNPTCDSAHYGGGLQARRDHGLHSVTTFCNHIL